MSSGLTCPLTLHCMLQVKSCNFNGGIIYTTAHWETLRGQISTCTVMYKLKAGTLKYFLNNFTLTLLFSLHIPDLFA